MIDAAKEHTPKCSISKPRKLLEKESSKIVGKDAVKSVGKTAAKSTAKTTGKALLKKIPIIGLLAGGLFSNSLIIAF